MLAIHAHPDDESINNGGLLAQCATHGDPAEVVTCTRGEQGEVIPESLQYLERDRSALAATREGELREALSALGVTRHRFLDELVGGHVTDSGMRWQPGGRVATAVSDAPASAFSRLDLEPAIELLAAHIVAMRPAIVVGYDPGGGYGHPDHVQAHRLMTVAARLARSLVMPDERDPWNMGEVWWTVQPRGVFAAVEAAMPQFSRVVEGELLPSIRVDTDDVIEIPLSEADIAAKIRALRAHQTQIVVEEYDNPHPVPGHDSLSVVAGYALSNGVWQPMVNAEWYLRAVDQ